MRSPKIKKLTAKQKLQIKAKIAQSDLAHHLTHHFYIKDKGGKLRLMAPLRRSQRMFLSLMEHIKIWDTHLTRVLILKSRKTGISTAEACRQLIEVLAHGYDAIVIAHDKATAEFIFSILRRAYDNYDLPKPKLDLESKKEIRFADREGYIEVFTANQVEATRGRTPQVVHGSEVAFWEKGTDAAVALFQAVAARKNTSVVLETTANGEDLLFKPLWDNASEFSRITYTDDPKGPFGFTIKHEVFDEDKWNGFFPLFISAIDDEEDCRMEIDDDEKKRLRQTLDEYETGLIERFNAPLEFIKWRRRTLAHQCRGDIRIFNQEYPVDPESAFIISGDPRFDIESLNQMVIEDGQSGYLAREDRWERRIVFLEDKYEKLRIFRRPEANHRYVIGIDTAEGHLPEGARDPDESVAQVLDIDAGPKGSLVATLGGQFSEEEMVDRVFLLGEYYNMAYLVPEWTGGHGQHLTIQLSKKYPVERIYHRADPFTDTQRGDALGLQLNVGNRNRLIADLADAIALPPDLEIRDAKTVKQCKHFKWNRKGKIEAAVGHHDDRVMALIGAVHGWKHYPLALRATDGYSQGELDLGWPIEEHYMNEGLPDPEGGY